MNTNETVLWSNKWMTIKEKSTEKYIDPYTYVSMDDAVAVLPYRKGDNGKFQFGVRKEIVPPWGYQPSVCCVGGSVENGNPLETAVIEVREEMGFQINIEDLLPIARLRNGKGTDSFTDYYLLEINRDADMEIMGDGSMYEQDAEFLWVSDYDIGQCDDYKLHMLLGFFIRIKLHDAFETSK